jgi:hypothetical protein
MIGHLSPLSIIVKVAVYGSSIALFSLEWMASSAFHPTKQTLHH